MLKVTVAEVARQALKQLGVNASLNWSLGGAGVGGLIDNPLTVATQTLSNTAIGIAANNNATAFSIRALERAGLWRTLAEPTLTAISGESAKFTAGGEIPVPANQTCTPSTVPGGRPSCTIGVEFKPFGVSLNFTPVVLSEGRISLRVATEVTDIDAENQVRFDNVNVPGFRVRKADTTVEVPSGGSLVTAGLIQQTTRQAINGFPGLAHLPVLGALFRSRDYQRNETELVISVTPYIARAVAPRDVRRPDEGFADAHDAQTILLGRLNRIYGSGNAAAAQGYRGPRRLHHGLRIAPMSFSPRRPAILAAALVATGLSACTTRTSPFVTSSIGPLEISERHPIVLSDAPRSLELFPGPYGLDGRQSNDLAIFLAEYREKGRSNLVIEAPGNGHGASTVRAALSRHGVPAHLVQTRHYAQPHYSVAAPVRLSYAALRARVPHACDKYTHDFGMSNPGFSARNEPFWNLGCASQSNLAAQVADPLDLVRPRQEDRIDTIRRTNAIGKLRQGQDPSTQYRSEASQINRAVGN